MSGIIDGGFITGKVVSPLYQSHVSLAREILSGYCGDTVGVDCEEIFGCVSDWFDGSEYRNNKGLADVDPRPFYAFPVIPGKSFSGADTVMLLIVGIEYAPLCILAKKKSLLIMISEILLYYGTAGEEKEVDRAAIWLLYLVDVKDQSPINISVEEQKKLMGQMRKYDARLLCLQNWINKMERKAMQEGNQLNAQSIIYTRDQMRGLLNDMFPSVFQSISQDTFNDFWKKQKMCKLKDGPR